MVSSKHRADKPRELTKRTGGRPPSVYRMELAIEVCEKIAQGGTLRAIERLDGMPPATAFRKWVLEHKDLHDMYALARSMAADAIFDEALDLAREIKETPETGTKVRAFDVLLHQLRWSAGKLNPQQYSERSSISFVVPIQINTPLDLGQGGDASGSGSVYEVEATITQEFEPGGVGSEAEGKAGSRKQTERTARKKGARA